MAKTSYTWNLSSQFYQLKIFCNQVRTVGVPSTSQILKGDCQKLSFSILTIVHFLIF